MAVPPTQDQIDDTIMEVIKARKLQPDTIFPVMQVHLALQKAGLPAAQINDGLQRLRDKGWLKGGTGPHWTLTAEGHKQFGPQPSTDQVERAILRQIATYNPAPDTIFPIMSINVNLQQQGLSADQIAEGLESMVAKGWLKEGTRHWTITAAGHGVM